MNNSSYALLRAIRGPVLLMGVGCLMAVHHFQDISFSKTWPALLILYGVLKLAERVTPRPTDGPFPGAGTATGM